MTEFIKGKTKSEIFEMMGHFHAMVTSNPNEEVTGEDLGKLAVFGGVREYPARVKCATLYWHTMQAALEREGTATTE